MEIYAKAYGITRKIVQMTSIEFSGLSADETVKKMFAAMNEWNEDQLKVVLRGVDLAAISKAYKGCTLVECDSAFKSGNYAGVFVQRQSLEHLDFGWGNLYFHVLYFVPYLYVY